MMRGRKRLRKKKRNIFLNEFLGEYIEYQRRFKSLGPKGIILHGINRKLDRIIRDCKDDDAPYVNAWIQHVLIYLDRIDTVFGKDEI